MLPLRLTPHLDSAVFKHLTLLAASRAVPTAVNADFLAGASTRLLVGGVLLALDEVRGKRGGGGGGRRASKKRKQDGVRAGMVWGPAGRGTTRRV